MILTCLAALALPNWMLFPTSAALANGTAAMGIAVLIKTGNVTFGQSLPLCIGSYSAAFLPHLVGINELFLGCLVAALTASVISFMLGMFLKRYSGIFFAMLTLAFSMVLYGSLANVSSFGGTDGFSVPTPSLLGYTPSAELRPMAMLLGIGVVASLCLHLTDRFWKTRTGWIVKAVGANDIRAGYLGADTRRAVWIAIIYSGALAGIGGALSSAVVGHVTPEIAYWTRSGELVLIAISGNSAYSVAIFAASLLIEAMRVTSSAMFPYTWQGGLGIMLLALVLLLPNGMDVIFKRIFATRRGRQGGG